MSGSILDRELMDFMELVDVGELAVCQSCGHEQKAFDGLLDACEECGKHALQPVRKDVRMPR